ncbi:16S rRNA pseudouridine(516) synthase RsuA [Dongshaea marina]|uniref:16S rRNA pseudouridine(516) synthase RsuA n=1 Tax=Dongshaea marina TaxID=2047966 RepID=UPI000D3EACCE|nr:16S rRNA pseudouridine(516) synthase RsuA [Dongshaea marina]
MRLDKFISETTSLTRSLAKKALHRGEICCDGEVVKNSAFKVKVGCKVTLNGELLELRGPRYIMLHKPIGYICSTIDEEHPSVLSLLKLNNRDRLCIAGRLDLDTTGLVLITDDGQWSHRITSPKKECGKRYRVQLADPVEASLTEQFAKGVELRGERELTRPAKLEIHSPTEVLLTIHEGKYHQVKRMFAAVGNKVIGLHRESVGEIELDPALEPGQWRYLSENEIKSV